MESFDSSFLKPSRNSRIVGRKNGLPKVRDEIDPLTAEEVSLFLQTVLNSKYYRDY
jgi:hypothetical protein